MRPPFASTSPRCAVRAVRDSPAPDDDAVANVVSQVQRSGKQTGSDGAGPEGRTDLDLQEYLDRLRQAGIGAV